MTSFIHITCDFCGSDPDSHIVLQVREFAVCTYRIVRCSNCGLVFVNPQPTRPSLYQMYDEPYFVSGEWKEVGYADYTGKERNWRLQAAKRNLEFVESYYRGGKGEVLDVGCAAGYFLKVAREAGWSVRGVEVSEYAANLARREFGLDVHIGVLSDARYPVQSFDVVTMFDTLEHVGSPSEELREVNRIMKHGGVLVLDSPNIESNVAVVQGKDFWLIKLDHIFYFSPGTIRSYLESHGFEVLTISRQLVSQWDPALKLFPGTSEGSHLTVVARKSDDLVSLESYARDAIEGLRFAEGPHEWHSSWDSLVRCGGLAVPCLVAALHDEMGSIRNAVASILAESGDVRAVPALAKAFGDKSSLVQKTLQRIELNRMKR